MSRIPLLALLLCCAATAVQADPPKPRVVQVTGQGEATVAPDRARLSMAIEARHAELRSAETTVSDSTRAALAALRKLDIAEADISTAGYTVNPEYDWVENQQRFRGYFARREVNVTVRDLDRVGDVMLALTKAGVNQINAPVLESSRMKDAERKALAEAVQDATAQARLIAEGLGQKLGLPHTINASTQGTPPPMPMPRMAMMKGAVADAASGNEQTGFTAGLIRVESTLTAEFELLAP